MVAESNPAYVIPTNHFSRWNLINAARFSKLDLISCRNELIYLEPEMQQSVIWLFHFALADPGPLLLGRSESIARADDLFEPIAKKWRISQKVASSRRTRRTIPRVMADGQQQWNAAHSPCDKDSSDIEQLEQELNTVKLELLDKVAELDIANNDILNRISSTEIATLFLNKDLLVQRFTPATVQLLNLRATEIGRPLSDITTRFIDACLVSDCRKVIQGSESIQCEVEGENARLYLRRILAYRSHGDQIGGVVITFVDLNLLQQWPMSGHNEGGYHELEVLRKDGSSFYADLIITRIDQLALFIVRICDASQRKKLQSKILDIASDEQRRIGQELHDGTQQELTRLSLLAGTIEDFFERKARGVNDDSQALTLEHAELSRLMLSASKLVQGLEEANQHVQSLSHGIMPVQIDAEGLQSVLTELAKATTVDGKVICQFDYPDSIEIESNTIATHLFRIAQEAVNNALRHGKAKEIRISLSIDPNQIQLEVSDDGIGVDASAAQSGGKVNNGVGLQIMDYRASVIGGVLSILADNNNGTIVRCTIKRLRKIR